MRSKIRKVKISAGVFVHNEQKTIERCLKSLYDVVDEILVVHDGPCSDNSLKIARKYTKNIYVRKWVGTCEGHFDFIVKKAKNKWIMLVDADEYLSEGLRKNLGELISNDNISCYEVYWPTYYQDKKFSLGIYRKFYKRVIFQKDKTRFEGYLHEKRKVIGKVARCEYQLIHKPDFNMSDPKYIESKIKWADVASKMILKKGLSHSKYYYFVKAHIWFLAYFIYYFFLKMYFLDGVLGYKYAIYSAKYNYRLNMNLYRGV